MGKRNYKIRAMIMHIIPTKNGHNGYFKTDWGYEKNNIVSFIDANDTVLDELYQKVKSEIEFIHQALAAE